MHFFFSGCIVVPVSKKGIAMLKPVKYKNTVDIAIEHIGNYIAKNMHVGDILPSERELAEKLQISRNITREALQHFRTLGIIESKPKIGATIANLLPNDVYANYRPFLAISPHTFHDLAHLRLTLELGCAGKAIENATDEDIEYLYSLCEKIYALSESGPEDNDLNKTIMHETDMEFHTKLMKLSNNALINSLLPLAIEFFDKQFMCSITYHIEDKKGYREHFEMVDAIKNKKLDQLSSLIRSHLDTYFKNYNNE